jgi:hypothetical protein
MKSTLTRSGFVADGCERARQALEPETRRQVEEEFAGQWKVPGFVRRLFLRRRIKKSRVGLLNAHRATRSTDPEHSFTASSLPLSPFAVSTGARRGEPMGLAGRRCEIPGHRIAVTRQTVQSSVSTT